MKHPTGYAKPRRSSAPRAVPKKKVRLDLKRRGMPEPEGGVETQQKNNFWKWVSLIALLHAIALGGAYLFYMTTAAPKPPEQFISLLPQGNVVKGNPGAQEAHKLGPTTSAPVVHHHSATPPPTPTSAVQPKTVEPPKPTSLADKPIVKPPPPKPPKVKVDLNVVDGPTPAVDKVKLKPHLKKPKPTLRPDDDSADDDREAAAKPDSAGLSREEIARRLGEKLDAAGIKTATQTGTSGSANAHPNNFADFYAMVHDQVLSQWQSPNLADETAVNPIVQIHVEKDGRVPAESVHLIQSSGNASYDDSAVAAAKNLGYLHEPLPEGCPPDMSINFKLTR
jgi:TonB family protein